MILLRHELGEVLREIRQDQGRTLRDVASSSAVSLGYLSELERGTKEASSELLASVCTGLGLSLSEVLELVRERVERVETLSAPVSLPVGHAMSDTVSASAACTGAPPTAAQRPLRPAVVGGRQPALAGRAREHRALARRRARHRHPHGVAAAPARPPRPRVHVGLLARTAGCRCSPASRCGGRRP